MQEFLAEHKLDVAIEVNAKKNTIFRDEAISLARKAQEIIAAKGKTVRRLNPRKDATPDEAIAALIIGPSGKLRAPTLRVGNRLLVGFDEAAYREVLGC